MKKLKLSTATIVALIIGVIIGGFGVFYFMTRPAPEPKDQTAPEVVAEAQEPEAEKPEDMAQDEIVSEQIHQETTEEPEPESETEPETVKETEGTHDLQSLEGKVIIMLNAYEGYAYAPEDAAKIREGILQDDDSKWAENFIAAYDGEGLPSSDLDATIYSTNGNFKFDLGGTAIVYILPYHEPTWAAVLELKRQSVSADAYECEYGKVNAYVIR